MHTNSPRGQCLFLPDISCPFLCIPEAAEPVSSILTDRTEFVSLGYLGMPWGVGSGSPTLEPKRAFVIASSNRMWHCMDSEDSLEKVVWSGIGKMAKWGAPRAHSSTETCKEWSRNCQSPGREFKVFRNQANAESRKGVSDKF